MGSDNVKVLFQIRVVASCGEGLIDTVMGLLSLLTRCLELSFAYVIFYSFRHDLLVLTVTAIDAKQLY